MTYLVKQPALEADSPRWHEMVDWLREHSPPEVHDLDDLARYFNAVRDGECNDTVWTFTFQDEHDATLFKLQWGFA